MQTTQLVKRLNEGDHHAYKFIFDNYYALMCSIEHDLAVLKNIQNCNYSFVF